MTAVSKVTLNGTTLIDVTSATASASEIIYPYTAMVASGIMTTGTRSATGMNVVDFIARAPITTFSDDNVITVGKGAFYNYDTLTNISFPNCTTVENNAFYNCTELTSINFPKCTWITNSSFQNCGKINSFYYPNLTTIGGGNAFNSAGTTSAVLVLPKLTTVPSINGLNSFRGTIIDLGETLTQINGYMFNGCNNLDTIILRGSALKPMVTLNALNTASKFNNGGTGGTIYIAKSLYDHLGDGTANDYQSASNWSTIHEYGTITWAKIEGSIYENAYADGTLIS